MPANFNRDWRVIVGTTEIVGLRVSFKAKKTGKADPNTLDLGIYNLSAATRAKVSADERPAVVLMAGYKGAAGVIFAGPARTIDHVREGADWKTHITCGDGEQAYVGVSSFSFKAGSRKGDVVARVTEDLKQLGIDTGDAKRALQEGGIAGLKEYFTQGYAAAGRSMKELDRLAQACGFEYSIVDGRLVITQLERPTNEEMVVLSPATGLIGSPDHGAPEKGAEEKKAVSLLKARALLNGELRPLRGMRLETSSRSGNYRIETVEHVGDSHGPEWFSNVEARPL